MVAEFIEAWLTEYSIPGDNLKDERFIHGEEPTDLSYVIDNFFLLMNASIRSWKMKILLITFQQVFLII